MKRNALLWIVMKIKNRLPAIAIMTTAQVGHALLCVWFALGSRGVIDSAVAGDREAFLDACLWQGMIILGILLCLALVRHLRERLRADLERDWKKRLLHGLLYGDYAAVSAYHSADLLNHMNQDVAKVNDGILTIVPSAAGLVTRLIAAVLVLGVLDYRFTALITILGCMVIGLTGILRRRIKDLNKSVSRHDGLVSGYIQEVMEKLLAVQAMGVEAVIENRADQLLEHRYELQRKRKNISVVSNIGISVVHYGAGFLALCWCACRILQGQMTFGSMTAVTQLVSQLQTPFVNMSGIMPQFLSMVASAERLMELDEIQGEPEKATMDVTDVYKNIHGIRAEALYFSYKQDEILNNVTFDIPKGTFTAITGPSGIGKSTLLKLMLGMFHLQSGSICLVGKDGNIALDRTTRKMFAYVPQGNLLLSGTLRENLLITNPAATDEQIAEAVFVSAMDEFLQQLPNGLDTVIGENAAGLSEGQAQRLSIARAVLSGAPVLLLDECTSALDEETEKTVLHRIKMLPNRTCIAVTHRPAALSVCNCQIELNGDGSISVKNIPGRNADV